MKHRYVGDHAISVVVGEKCPALGQGDFVDLSATDVKELVNADLIARGLLVPIDEEVKKGAKA